MSEVEGKIIYVKKNDKLYAIIIKSNFRGDGINFLTPSTFSLQLAVMSHPTGKIIPAPLE